MTLRKLSNINIPGKTIPWLKETDTKHPLKSKRAIIGCSHTEYQSIDSYLALGLPSWFWPSERTFSGHFRAHF